MVTTMIVVCTLLPKTVVCTQCKSINKLSKFVTKQEVLVIVAKESKRLNVKLTDEDAYAITRIVDRESDGNLFMRNKRSSSAGLSGFLSSTWKDVGIKKTWCPHCQIRAMILYIKSRYKTPKRALQFHLSRGYY